MDSKRTCSDFWKNRKNMQSLISQGLAGQINPIFIGYLNCSPFPKIDILRQRNVDFTYYLFTLHYSLKIIVDFWEVIGNSE